MELELVHVPINVAFAGNNVLIPSFPGQRIEIWQLFLYNVAAQNLELFADNDSQSGPLNAFPATSGFSLPYTGAPHFKLQAGKAFILRTSAGTQVSGFVNYRLITP